MRLGVLSDLHQELPPWQMTELKVDVLALVGDISTGIQGRKLGPGAVGQHR